MPKTIKSPLSKSSEELPVFNSFNSPTKKAVLFLQILKDIEDNTINRLLPEFSPQQKTIIKEIISFHATQKIDQILLSENKENIKKNDTILSFQTSTENLLVYFNQRWHINERIFDMLSGMQKSETFIKICWISTSVIILAMLTTL